jgi:hypothetical protein
MEGKLADELPMGPGQIRFRIHGTDSDRGDDDLAADVFARKILDLVHALSAADAAVNGKKAYEYVIARLNSSSPTATCQERVVRWKTPRFDTHSAIGAFSLCATAIIEGRTEQARRFGKCAEYISKLGIGARKTFEYGELWVSEQQVFRVDSFLFERASAVVDPSKEIHPEHEETLFNGVSFGSFDGTVQVADLRGSLPAIKLILSAGKKQIDCVCRSTDIEKIRAALNRRVRISGRAIYDGRSPLPRRLEVADIQPVPTDLDFSKWKGTFEPFEIPDWGSDPG